MNNFEHRRDRFEAFQRYDNPLVNLTFNLSLPDFRPFCKAHNIPPFHFFLYCILTSVHEHENFMYRIYEGEVIRITEFYASYTVINEDNNLNYARFDMTHDLHEFIARSVSAGQSARARRALLNAAIDLSPRELKNNVYITCLPWFQLSSISHPIFRADEADIPMIAWAKFSEPQGDRMTVPFSVQAHHGFVDGIHIHQLTGMLAAKIEKLIA